MADANDELIQEFVRTRGAHLGFLRVLCRDPEAAEELFQELALAVMHSIDAYDHAKDFGAWVRGIARNLYRKAARTDKRLHDRIAFAPEVETAVDRAFEGAGASGGYNRRAEYLRRCMEGMEKRHRGLIRDRYESNLPLARIAELHRKTISAVETALSRIRSALLECIKRKERAEA
jgi:RNA polymerase sigma-70 factor, ECF subfamily